MKRKDVELLEAKAADGEAGTFSALASVFGNVDRTGDRMLKGSFSKTLAKWRRSGKPIPVILSHEWSDPHKYVGEADPRTVYEDERGLVVQGKMYIKEELGRKVYDLMRRGILTGWSFGYQVPEGGQQQKNGVNEISEVELFEVGPTLVGANAEAQLQEIKSVLGVEDDDLRVRAKAAVAEALSPRPARDHRPELTPEMDLLVERSRLEHQARKEAEEAAARQAEEEAADLRRRSLNITKPRALVFKGGRYKALAPDAQLASAEEIAEHKKLEARQAEAKRAVEAARAKAFQERPATISVCGVRARVSDGVIVDR